MTRAGVLAPHLAHDGLPKRAWTTPAAAWRRARSQCRSHPGVVYVAFLCPVCDRWHVARERTR